MDKLTPVAVIGFVRPKVLRRTLLGLSEAQDVLNRDVFVYLSCPRDDIEKVKTDKVLEVVQEIKEAVLPNIVIIQRSENLGCSGNIRYAIDKTLENSSRVIVIEEDVRVSKTFLRYMDGALDYYESDKRIWAVNGYHNLFLKVPKTYRYDVLLNPRNMCWGWATWRDRWCSTDFTLDGWPDFRKDATQMARLTAAGSDIASMIECGYESRNSVWDATASWYLVRNNLYTIECVYSQTKSIGICSEDAQHCSLPHGYYEKQKFYNFMPRFVPVDDLLKEGEKLQGRFRHSVSDHRLIPFAWRCIMRVLKHFIGPMNDEPITKGNKL